jgi:hypothetical protein
MNFRTRKISIAIGSVLVIGIVISILNGRSFLDFLFPVIMFSLLVGVIVGVLDWTIEYSQNKGYSAWFGFLLVFLFNLVGLVVLLLLPDRSNKS